MFVKDRCESITKIGIVDCNYIEKEASFNIFQINSFLLLAVVRDPALMALISLVNSSKLSSNLSSSKNSMCFRSDLIKPRPPRGRNSFSIIHGMIETLLSTAYFASKVYQFLSFFSVNPLRSMTDL